MTTALRDPIDPVLPSRERDTLVAHAQGLTTREAAIAALGLRDYADLLVVLGDADLTPPRPAADEVAAQALAFERVWRTA